MLEFDTETRNILDNAYLGSDFAARRRANFEALDPRPGETVLDLGCGNGLLTVELARAVGPTGRVIGVDLSEDMLESARERCAGLENVELIQGGAEALPVEDGSIDKIISVQVFEYIAALDKALTECRRALRPNGRLVIGDMHFSSCCWHSEDPDRMARMLKSWDAHLVWTDLPARLAAAFLKNGLRPRDVRPFPMTDSVFRTDGIARMMVILMSAFALSNGHVEEETVAAWAKEQEELAAKSAFFFSLTHFVWTADAP